MAAAKHEAPKRRHPRADKRRDRMTQAQRNAYRNRATLWAKGASVTGRHVDGTFEGDFSFAAHIPRRKHQDVATFATYAPLRWHITARCVCDGTNGQRYESVVEGECGQVQTLHNLQDLRDELMRQARQSVNTKHIVDETFDMEVLG